MFALVEVAYDPVTDGVGNVKFRKLVEQGEVSDRVERLGMEMTVTYTLVRRMSVTLFNNVINAAVWLSQWVDKRIGRPEAAKWVAR